MLASRRDPESVDGQPAWCPFRLKRFRHSQRLAASIFAVMIRSRRVARQNERIASFTAPRSRRPRTTSTPISLTSSTRSRGSTCQRAGGSRASSYEAGRPARSGTSARSKAWGCRTPPLCWPRSTGAPYASSTPNAVRAGPSATRLTGWPMTKPTAATTPTTGVAAGAVTLHAVRSDATTMAAASPSGATRTPLTRSPAARSTATPRPAPMAASRTGKRTHETVSDDEASVHEPFNPRTPSLPSFHAWLRPRLSPRPPNRRRR
jgi:hypothetical protein